MTLTTLTIHESHQKLKNKEISATELTQAFLDRIDQLDNQIKSYISLCPEFALSQAKHLDNTILKKSSFPTLTGIPLAPKDIYLTKDIPTTCGSKILKNYYPPYQSTVIQKCLDQHAIILGKT
ncbi:hypothetical protein BVY03_00205, partial [bacterium K02(2017)]